MSGKDTLPVKAPSEGIPGLSMIAPFIGLPLFIHALSGAVLTGLGFAAFSSFTLPFAGKILRRSDGLTGKNPLVFDQDRIESSIHEPIEIKGTVIEVLD